MSELRLTGRDVTLIAGRRSDRRAAAIAIALAALALLLVAACAGLGVPIVAPKVSVEGIAIGAVRGGDAPVTLSVRVENPNAIDLTLQSLRFAFSVNDIVLTNGAALQAGTIEARASKVIDVDTHTDMNAVLRLIALSVGRRTAPLQYVLDGEAIVQNGLHLPFSRRGDIPLPGAPSPAPPPR